MSLFAEQEQRDAEKRKTQDAAAAPLADRMRPRTLEEFIGQRHLLAEGKILHRIIDSGEIPSLIFWGPPGCGKTSLARLMSETPGYAFRHFSAVLSGVKEVRAAIEEAKRERDLRGTRTILFVDEIHRFNKAQQDAFLPHVESGLVVLIGATTENPSFEINSPLLSRCRVLTLLELEPEEIAVICRSALGDEERGLGRHKIEIAPETLARLSREVNGDARQSLNALETALHAQRRTVPPGTPIPITDEVLAEALQSKHLLYDRSGEDHYNVTSAFIKSLRGSDPDAALYWLARMLESGEDPHFIIRRMILFAAEDIGNADPRALQVATSTMAAFDVVGLPEGWIPMAQATTYLATAPKSNAAYKGYLAAKLDVGEHGSLPVPLHLRNAPTRLMKESGYGKGYKYPHDFPGHHVPQQYLPDAIAERTYYHPEALGEEGAITERLDAWRATARRSGGKGETASKGSASPETKPVPRRGPTKRSASAGGQA